MKALFGQNRNCKERQPLARMPLLELGGDGTYQLRVVKTTLELPGVTLTTRGFNGQVPGPTLRVRAGQTVRIAFQNCHSGFVEQELGQHDRKGAFTGCREYEPSVTNLHVHGWHVAPDEDDIFRAVALGKNITYSYNLPSDHHAGSSWYHPHVHGNTGGQVMGGMAGALIVEDDWKTVENHGNIAKWLQSISRPDRDVTAVIQHWNFRTQCDNDFVFGPYGSLFNRCLGSLLHNTLAYGDEAVKVKFHSREWMNKEVLTVNGQYDPVLSLVKDRWYRLRLIFAGAASSVSLGCPSGCTWLLLAKDGIYVDDLPRRLDKSGVFIAPGGRVDVAIKCFSPTPAPFVTREMDFGMWTGLAIPKGILMMSLKVTDGHGAPEEPPPASAAGAYSWKPDSLRDLREEPAEDYTLTYAPTTWSGGHDAICRETGMKVCKGVEVCFPPTGMKGFMRGANTMDVFHHGSPPLAVMQKDKVYRMKVELFHVHHMHTYPVQLDHAVVSGNDFNPTDAEFPNFFKSGDWHDTLQLGSDWFLRFRTSEFIGPIVVHCHMLEHEDSGMMGYFKVVAFDKAFLATSGSDCIRKCEEDSKDDAAVSYCQAIQSLADCEAAVAQIGSLGKVMFNAGNILLAGQPDGCSAPSPKTAMWKEPAGSQVETRNICGRYK
jgi:FtsP/CotA-like multicopper oxidase with cupredoxin domain